jgi:hypothetical protein
MSGERDNLPGGLIRASHDGRGVAVYPGQSAADVMLVTNVIQRELDDVGHYVARDVARKILLSLRESGLIDYKK